MESTERVSAKETGKGLEEDLGRETSPPCHLCGLPSAWSFEGEDRSRGRPGRFPVFRCSRCDLWFLWPLPSHEELAVFYEGGSQPVSEGASPAISSALRKATKRKLEWIRSVGGHGRLLDIGCNDGAFLAAAREGGWFDVFGIDQNDVAVDGLARMRGMKHRVACGPFPSQGIPFEWGSFDVITLWHVFEHLRAPNEALRVVKERLAEDGVLVVNVPDPDCLQMRLFGAAWSGFDVPRHLFVFGRRGLISFFEERGLEAIGEKAIDDALGAFLYSCQFAIGRTRWRIVDRCVRMLQRRPLTYLFNGIFSLAVPVIGSGSRAFAFRKTRQRTPNRTCDQSNVAS